MSNRVLVVAPSWVGDAILTEPLVARLRALHGDSRVDVLAPAWCAPVYARMPGVGAAWSHPRSVMAGSTGSSGAACHGSFGTRLARACVLPNSWKSAQFRAGAHPRRTGCRGNALGPHNDAVGSTARRYRGWSTIRGIGRTPGHSVDAAAPTLVHPTPGIARLDARAAADRRPAGGHSVSGCRIRAAKRCRRALGRARAEVSWRTG